MGSYYQVVKELATKLSEAEREYRLAEAQHRNAAHDLEEAEEEERQAREKMEACLATLKEWQAEEKRIQAIVNGGAQ